MKKIFETDRLIIREWEMKDKNDLYEYASNPEVTKYLTFPTYTSIQCAIDRINDLLARYQVNGYIQDYAIELKEACKVIGSIGIVQYKQENEGCVEIGYCLSPSYQHFGYMTEALKGYIKYIKANSIAKRIQAKHDVENYKSGMVMQRAGMTKEGILRKYGSNNLHSRHDTAIYSILDEEIIL